MSRAGTSRTRTGFSVHDRVISNAHRAFYERMAGELNTILPICNQGKCRAIEISETGARRDQLMGLMKRAETFSRRLLDLTGELFSDFYQAKSDFSRSIHLDTAYIKVNLVDRNLLERTCDVRWWALETSFAKCVAQADSTRAALAELAAAAPEDTTGDNGDTLQRLLDNRDSGLAQPDWRRQMLAELPVSGAGLSGQAASAVDQARAGLEALDRSVAFACRRLEDIRRSYTLYRDLVIADHGGHVLASSNPRRRGDVLGLGVAEESWFTQALQLKDGDQYHAQDLTGSCVETESASLVYSTAIRRDANVHGEAIGVMGIFFDFQSEARIILDDFMPRDDAGIILDGWFSLLSDRNDVVIASSDEFVFPVGQRVNLPRAHRQLDAGQRAAGDAIIGGRETVVYSAATDGYLDYPGLGWTSHLIVDRSSVFATEDSSDADEAIDRERLLASRLIPETNRRAFEAVQDDKFALQRISLNGIIFASRLGRRGLSLGPVFAEITRIGDDVTEKMEQLLGEMAISEFQLSQQALANSARQAIELIDRNLFERAADVRWWSTDEYFWTALMQPEDDAFERASERLGVINQSYAMYRNLVLADADGQIVASSDPAQRAELSAISVAGHDWFREAMATRASSAFVVQDVTRSSLEPDQPQSLIYAGGIRRDGERTGEAIGALGILFDWQTEAGKILQACLPHDQAGQPIAGCLAVYTDRAGRVIETTDPQRIDLEQRLELPAEVDALAPGTACAHLFSVDGHDYLAGSARTRGYREYQGLGWLAHILRPL